MPWVARVRIGNEVGQEAQRDTAGKRSYGIDINDEIACGALQTAGR